MKNTFDIKLKDIILLPNIISFLRIALIIPFGIMLSKSGFNAKITTIILGLIIGFTDFLDGLLARKFNQSSELGKILDPLADKLVFIVGAVLFVPFKGLPIWIMIYIIARDVLVFSIGGYLSAKRKEVIPSTFTGKFSTVILSLAFLSIIIFDINFIASAILLYLGLVAFTFATLNYALVFLFPDKNVQIKLSIRIIVYFIFFSIIIILTLLGMFNYYTLPDPFYIFMLPS